MNAMAKGKVRALRVNMTKAEAFAMGFEFPAQILKSESGKEIRE
jgi:hypothetical protein